MPKDVVAQAAGVSTGPVALSVTSMSEQAATASKIIDINIDLDLDMDIDTDIDIDTEMYVDLLSNPTG